jgi:ribosomal protein S21
MKEERVVSEREERVDSRPERNDRKDGYKKGGYNKNYKKEDPKDYIQPLEIKVDFPNDMAALERAMRKLTRAIKKEGVFKEYMWRRYKRETKEKKPKYFDK